MNYWIAPGVFAFVPNDQRKLGCENLKCIQLLQSIVLFPALIQLFSSACLASNVPLCLLLLKIPRRSVFFQTVTTMLASSH